MRRIHFSAILIALTMALASCGSDDEQNTSTAAAGTSTPEQSDQPSTTMGKGPDVAAKKDSETTGSGGSSSPDADRPAAPEKQDQPNDRASGKGEQKRKAAAPKTPAEQIATLSPSERRALHHDLYEQGKTACYVYGPEELAKSLNVPNTDPATVARLYATAYEKAVPSLILPYQQGCLAGLRKFERNPPENPPQS